IAELAETQILAADDLDADGQQELLFLRGTELHIGRWTDNSLQSVWHFLGAAPLLKPQSIEGDIRLFAANTALIKGNTTVWRNTPNSPEFLIRFPDGVFACRLGPEGLEKKTHVTMHEALGNLPSGQSRERVVFDGTKAMTFVEDREVYRY